MAGHLRGMGWEVETGDGWFAAPGGGASPKGTAAPLDPASDHRIAMALAVAGCVAQGGPHSRPGLCGGKSWPGFWAHGNLSFRRLREGANAQYRPRSRGMLAWDAPFLPVAAEISGSSRWRASRVRSAPGLGLDAAARWAARAAGGGCPPGDGGCCIPVRARVVSVPRPAARRKGRARRRRPRYRLGRLPALRLEDADLERRLRPALGSEKRCLRRPFFPC